MSEAVRSILEMIRRLPVDDRVVLADEVDRLAWRERVDIAMKGVTAVPSDDQPLHDSDIDAETKLARTEKSLYERYWTHRRRSAR